MTVKQIKQSGSKTLYQHFPFAPILVPGGANWNFEGGGGFDQTGIWRNQNFILGFAKLEFGQTNILGFFFYRRRGFKFTPYLVKLSKTDFHAMTHEDRSVIYTKPFSSRSRNSKDSKKPTYIAALGDHLSRLVFTGSGGWGVAWPSCRPPPRIGYWLSYGTTQKTFV